MTGAGGRGGAVEMHIESIRLKNFKSFKDVKMLDIPSCCVVVGANGAGKSTLFDVLRFSEGLPDVQRASGVADSGRLFRDHQPGRRSEFADRDRSQVPPGDRARRSSRHLSSQNRAGTEPARRPAEILRYKRGRYGSPFRFLDFTDGSGYAITNEELFDKSDEELIREPQSVGRDVLAIKGLGQFERFKAASAFRQLIENWHVSDFHINLARGSKDAAGYADHLSVTGDNLQVGGQEHSRECARCFSPGSSQP